MRNLDRMLEFYTGVLGFDVERGDGSSLVLGGGLFRIDLVHSPDAPIRPYPCTGLYHFALVVPDRAALGGILRRIVAQGVVLEGMADHAVSEALYLRDPEMNGIELYRDRPRADWPYADGEIAMVSVQLDTDGVLASARQASPLDPATRFGHIHLHVPDLDGARSFYEEALGLAVTQGSYPGALFLAAGDYHHHVGANTWAPDRPVPDGSTGLLSYTWRIPSGTPAPADELVDPAGALVLFEPG